MTDKEKAELVCEIEKSIIEKMKGTYIRKNTQAALAETRIKWFNSPVNNGPSLMFDIFGTYKYAAVWDCIRKLTCLICGANYCRNIVPEMGANEVAENLCQLVYDLRKQALNKMPATKKEAPEGYKLNPEYIEAKSKRVQLLLQPSTVDAIKALAKKKGLSMNEAINEAIQAYLQNEGE
ncbi:CopG family transcriptional regulator [Candidatus Saccharibacteria bacterium]|nr:CopG family transcriptional regulator [Candidatus Saccharibacteria bacterium]